MWAMSSTLSSQSGSDDLPKPGCDGAPLLREHIEKGHVQSDAGAAVQVEYRRALAALEHLKLDTRDRDHVTPQYEFVTTAAALCPVFAGYDNVAARVRSPMPRAAWRFRLRRIRAPPARSRYARPMSAPAG